MELEILRKSCDGADVRKLADTQSSRRTAAIASLKVGKGFWYQLAGRAVGGRFAARSWAHSVINENNPSSTGVVRAMAGSDH